MGASSHQLPREEPTEESLESQRNIFEQSFKEFHKGRSLSFKPRDDEMNNVKQPSFGRSKTIVGDPAQGTQELELESIENSNDLPKFGKAQSDFRDLRNQQR